MRARGPQKDGRGRAGCVNLPRLGTRRCFCGGLKDGRHAIDHVYSGPLRNRNYCLVDLVSRVLCLWRDGKHG